MSVDHVVKNLGVVEDDVKEEISRLMESDVGEGIADRFVSYKGILQTNRCSPMQYVKAVEYVSHRISGKTIKKSYEETFPDKLMRSGVRKPEGTINSLCQLFDKGKLVQEILKQVQIPLHVIMMNERVTAASVLANLMVNGETERIQMESADKFLNHVQVPETIKMEMDMTVSGDETLKNIGASLDQLAQFAHAKIEAGIMTPVEVIES